MKLQKYFARTGYKGPASPTLPVLENLLRAHVRHVPFEALDVQLGKPVSIEPEAAYDKIVNRRRGGWCYEQNGLFGWALITIGFEVTRIAAAVRRDERGDVANANHLCLLVRTEDTNDTWLVDVGFGGSMIAPIRLEQGQHDQQPFQIGLRRTTDAYWQFWEKLDGSEFNFDFRPQAADEAALAAKCEFLQTSPDSGFVQNLVAQIRMPSAHIALRGKVLKRATPDGVTSRLLESPEDLVAVLQDIFHLELPEAAGLWPRIERHHEELFRDEAVADNDATRLRRRR